MNNSLWFTEGALDRALSSDQAELIGGWTQRIRDDMEPVLVRATPELRALRVWHWRRAMAARATAKSYRENQCGAAGTAYSLRQARACDRRADFHIRCVQALNDVVSGTAEADDKIMPRESMHNE